MKQVINNYNDLDTLDSVIGTQMLGKRGWGDPIPIPPGYNDLPWERRPWWVFWRREPWRRRRLVLIRPPFDYTWWPEECKK